MLDKVLEILEEKNDFILDENQIEYLIKICNEEESDEEESDEEESDEEEILKNILTKFSEKYPHMISEKNIESLLKEY